MNKQTELILTSIKDIVTKLINFTDKIKINKYREEVVKMIKTYNLVVEKLKEPTEQNLFEIIKIQNEIFKISYELLTRYNLVIAFSEDEETSNGFWDANTSSSSESEDDSDTEISTKFVSIGNDDIVNEFYNNYNLDGISFYDNHSFIDTINKYYHDESF